MLMGCFACINDWNKVFAAGTKHKGVGKAWNGWKKGDFQVHFIYTGVCESMFIIFPDATTMLLDCGDHNAIGRGELAVSILPDSNRHAGEWIARYVLRVNPKGKDVDYIMLSHYHSDHGGCEVFYSSKDMRDGEEYILSGFSEAAEYLNFKKAIDRCWPDYSDPIVLKDDSESQLTHMKKFYNYMQKHRGMKMEKFRLGEVNQIRMLSDAQSYPDFSVRNICANGRIAYENGVIRDLYAEKIQKEHPDVLNENGMSLGMVFKYGDFSFFTAGDFSDKWELPNGEVFEIEDALADVCGEAQVAKLNHHGYYSMPKKLIKALHSKVYVSCVWDQLHDVSPVMERLSDRSIYPGGRIICPTIMPKERRKEDAGKKWLDDVDKSSYEGGHIVLNVTNAGKDYSITYLSANDESMKVRSVMEFKS